MILIFLSILSASFQFDEKLMLDKARGMHLLGAFADALGAPTEDANSAHECHYSLPKDRSCKLIVADTWYNESMFPNIWKIWPPPVTFFQEYIKGMKGIYTDDTCLRVALWNPFLKDLKSSNLDDLESKYKQWSVEMQEKLYKYHLVDPKDWYEMRRRKMIADNICMMDIANIQPMNKCDPKHGSNPFFFKNEPTAFGLYMYLETGYGFGLINELCNLYTDFELFEYFTNFTKLDESYAHEVTGIAATIVAKAVSEDYGKTNLGFGVWLRQNIFQWIDDFIKQSKTSEQISILERFKAEFEDMYQLSDMIRKSSHPSPSIDLFLETYCVNVYDNTSRTPQHGMKPHDPLTMLKLILFATNFATDYENTKQTDVLFTHKLIMSAPADTDTVGNFVGIMMGSYYGYSKLKEMKCDGKYTLEDDFRAIERFMIEFYGYDPLLQPFEVYHQWAKKICKQK